jgi:SAM-dependent methyltransferase
MLATDRNVEIPWSEVRHFDGVIDSRRFYEATLPTISQLHFQAATHPLASNELQTLRKHMRDMPAESICDLGCGLGDWASVYGPTATRIHLVDLSPSVLACAKERVLSWAPASRVTCQIFDVFNEEDWRSLAGFRMYLLAFVVGHATEPRRVGAIASLRAAVRKGDRVVVIDSLKPSHQEDADIVRCVDIGGNLVGVPKHYFDREEVMALASQAGFEVAYSWWGRRHFMVELL